MARLMNSGKIMKLKRTILQAVKKGCAPPVIGIMDDTNYVSITEVKGIFKAVQEWTTSQSI